MESDSKIGIFFDCENIKYKYAPDILDYIKQYGRILVQRAYADWTHDQNKKWANTAKMLNVEMVQCTHMNNMKNTSDMVMCIDIMKELRSSNVTHYFIISSDSDFTPLVRQIKKHDKMVLGVGYENSNLMYKSSFDSFLPLPDPVRRRVQATSTMRPCDVSKTCQMTQNQQSHTVPTSPTEAFTLDTPVTPCPTSQTRIDCEVQKTIEYVGCITESLLLNSNGKINISQIQDRIKHDGKKEHVKKLFKYRQFSRFMEDACEKQFQNRFIIMKNCDTVWIQTALLQSEN